MDYDSRYTHPLPLLPVIDKRKEWLGGYVSRSLGGYYVQEIVVRIEDEVDDERSNPAEGTPHYIERRPRCATSREVVKYIQGFDKHLAEQQSS